MVPSAGAENASDSVSWKKAALWLEDESHSVKGKLYVTRTRVLFEPSRFHAKGWHWYALFGQVVSVSSEGSSLLPRPGGTPARLRIDLTDGRSQYFVVDHLQRVVEVISAAAAASAI